MKGVRIVTAPSSASAGEDCRGNVLISGSYCGEYNAYHAGKRGIRGVIMSDAGVGKNEAGIRGLSYLDRVQLPAATADARTCHIGDAEHMLEHGTISYVNYSARRLGCGPGQSVKECAEHLCGGPVIEAAMPPIEGGKRHRMNGEQLPAILCLDAAPMLEDGDAGSIVITGSHAALFRGKPDGLIAQEVRAIFFSDAGVGLDAAGIARLALLDERGIVAGTASAESAAIGDARSVYEDGILSHVNQAAAQAGADPGMRVRDFVAALALRWRPHS